VLYRLREGVFQAPANEKLKNILLALFNKSKLRINNIVKKCEEFREDSSDLMDAFIALDGETTFLLDLLTENADKFYEACQSTEFKEKAFSF
jgi:hypothetical protein